MNTFLGELCTPAGVYLSISIMIIIFESLYILTKNLAKTTEIIFNELITFFFVVAWTYILNFLCNRTYINLVWGLVIINFIFSYFALLAIVTKEMPYQYMTWSQVVDASNQSVATAPTSK